MGPWGAHPIKKPTLAAKRRHVGCSPRCAAAAAPSRHRFGYQPTSPQNGFGRWALEAPTLITNAPSPPGGLTPWALGAPSLLTSSPRRLRPWGAHFVYKATSPQNGFRRWALEAPTLLRNPPSPPSGFAHWAPAAPVFLSLLPPPRAFAHWALWAPIGFKTVPSHWARRRPSWPAGLFIGTRPSHPIFLTPGDDRSAALTGGLSTNLDDVRPFGHRRHVWYLFDTRLSP